MQRVILLLSFFFMQPGCESSNPEPEIANLQISELIVNVDHIPIFIEKEDNDLVHITINAQGEGGTDNLNEIRIDLSDYEGLETCASATLYYAGKSKFSTGKALFAQVDHLSTTTIFQGNLEITKGISQFTLSIHPREDLKINSVIQIKKVEAAFSQEASTKTDVNETLLFAQELRAKYQDNCDTYRIPGLATTNNGTLIAVYDNRYPDRYDLQNDIDVGMSRSTDEGKSWGPMKVILGILDEGVENLNLQKITVKAILKN